MGIRLFFHVLSKTSGVQLVSTGVRNDTPLHGKTTYPKRVGVQLVSTGVHTDTPLHDQQQGGVYWVVIVRCSSRQFINLRRSITFSYPSTINGGGTVNPYRQASLPCLTINSTMVSFATITSISCHFQGLLHPYFLVPLLCSPGDIRSPSLLYLHFPPDSGNSFSLFGI